MASSCMAEGGMAEAEESKDEDMDAILDHCAKEAMSAIESKDHERFIDAMHVLVGDLLEKMSK